MPSWRSVSAKRGIDAVGRCGEVSRKREGRPKTAFPRGFARAMIYAVAIADRTLRRTGRPTSLKPTSLIAQAESSGTADLVVTKAVKSYAPKAALVGTVPVTRKSSKWLGEMLTARSASPSLLVPTPIGEEARDVVPSKSDTWSPTMFRIGGKLTLKTVAKSWSAPVGAYEDAAHALDDEADAKRHDDGGRSRSDPQ
jgi:hypothetical protein